MMERRPRKASQVADHTTHAHIRQAGDIPDADDAPSTRAAALREELFGSDLTVDEVAYVLRWDRSTVLKYLRDHVITGYQLGREWRVAESDLREYVRRVRSESYEEAKRTLATAALSERLRRLRFARPDQDWRVLPCVQCGEDMLIARKDGCDGYEGTCSSCGHDAWVPQHAVVRSASEEPPSLTEDELARLMPPDDEEADVYPIGLPVEVGEYEV